MAMGTNDQQVIHPFFRQEFGVSVKSIPSNEPISPVNTHAYEPQPISSGSSTHEQDLQALENLDSKVSKINNESSLNLDEDLNEDRRKRRRTDKAQTTEPTTASSAGLSEWLGHNTTNNVPASTDHTPETEINSSTTKLEAPLAETQLPGDELQPLEPTTNKKPEDRVVRTSARQKILKLNSKGGFLSSPVSSPPREIKKKTTGKRGRPRKAESKVVTIKYSVAMDKNTGKLIDDILGGRVVQKPPAATPSVQPCKTKTKPRKPTHPFFSKKPAQKSGPASLNGSQSDNPDTSAGVPSNQATAGAPDRKRIVPASGGSFTSFPRRASRFPELLDPLWPPQDLVHVTDVQPPRLVNDRAWHTTQDRKKSKIAAISIRDEENVLLVGTAEARRIASLPKQEYDALGILRHPVRHVASSQVLHTAMERQMSWSSPNRQFPWNSSSPPLARLRSALLTSVSAFDCATYEPQLWTHKYAPQSAEDVLQLGREPHMLRDWLRNLKITAVDTGKSSKENAKAKSKREKKAKKRQKAYKLDDFVVSSDEEASEMDNLPGSDDELAGGVTTTPQRTVIRSGDVASGLHGVEKKTPMTNAILLSGPAGSGKTASVYAVAKELDFEVFEINAGSRRSARDMLERVGDMTQNHLVHLLNESDNSTDNDKDSAKQNKLKSFFKGTSSKASNPGSQSGEPSPKPESAPKRPRSQKQSLILLEEADILFEEDRQFWTGVLTLISQSKRPIVITCNDESLIPTQDMSLHAILRYRKAAPDFSVDYLLLVAANEGHMLKREAVTRLYQGSGMDLRKSLMDLTFWCQMGVGSEKAGLDWLLPSWPPGSNVDHDGDRLRVLSLNTYERYMGWFNRDMILTQGSLDEETEIIRNSLKSWDLGLQDSEDMAGKSQVELLPPDQLQSIPKTTQLDMLCREADYYDMRSSLDILCSSLSTDTRTDAVDISAPPPPEGYRSNYLDNYPLLHTELRTEYSCLSETVSSTFEALISKTFRPSTTEDLESQYAGRVLSKIIISAMPPQTPPSTLPQFQRIFEPIMRANYSNPTPTARHAPSFENGLAPITEDLAPYIRSIMVFDARLQQYREMLYALTAQEHGRDKRSRTTRASRAALEGGDKASTRKERWFALDTPYYKVQGTAGPEWQNVLFQMGYFHIQPMVEASPERSDHVSDQAMENAE
ncbi:ATPase, AAA-type, core [Penicillium griseofulvum]|uniref:ATPase, AAA-type, core n=1 Tax=Penicillium patulum TaxID=5078 RepID=A0A135LUY4_PENPA|nr:ATPase, AAA-type, core [Penicillium griseofulvum]KXG52784.1 ATPase, AAA-type, core [Penicillium griseofulvum]